MKKTKTWMQYEAGREYKRRIGFYETAARNEAFYRGEQWSGVAGESELPRPVFNVVRRVTDYLVGAVAGGRLSVIYSDDTVIAAGNDAQGEALRHGVDILNRHIAYRWENCRMDRLAYRLLLDAAVTGDGVLYCYWDTNAAGMPDGDIRTVRHDACDVYASDMNRADIQSQDYIILAGRESVRALRREAREVGLTSETVSKIRSDAAMSYDASGRSYPELRDEDEAKATVLHKFWREDGVVWMEKSTAEVVIRRVKTGLRLYPVAYFNWMPTRGSFHGTSPVSGMIANQKFINRAYAMVMKHMTDTAFSKIIYDKSRIPEWTNEVGQAIAAVGGNLADAVQVVGVGQMQGDYMALIENAIAMTKEMSGATDTVLGSAQAANTSAILALQEASRTALQQVSASYTQCIEDVADIWADMLCVAYEGNRMLPYDAGGECVCAAVDFEALRAGLLHARVEVGNLTQYSASGTQNALDRLLDGGHITLKQYLEQLPTGILPMRARLLAEIERDSETEEGGEQNETGKSGDRDSDGNGDGSR